METTTDLVPVEGSSLWDNQALALGIVIGAAFMPICYVAGRGIGRLYLSWKDRRKNKVEVVTA